METRLLNGLTISQKAVLRQWPALMRRFFRDEWRSAAWGCSCGILTGAVIAWFVENGETLQQQQLNLRSDDWENTVRVLSPYATYLWLAVVPITTVFLVATIRSVIRISRSWFYGVTSGAFFFSFLIAIGATWNPASVSAERGLIVLAMTLAALLVGFAIRLCNAVVRLRSRRVEVAVQAPDSRISYTARDAESPIESIDEDKLGRSALVEMLALKILVSRVPVLALRGNFGDGKSSLLNLLRQLVEEQAIVVSFSTWLPDSEKTLVSDLLGDIATEINASFYIPALRKSIEQFASVLSGDVPYLKALTGILPPNTQREELTQLEELLSRLPWRVVVLLDEIDRMQREELLTLLKVLRGAASLPNITFVCAFHQEQVERIIHGTFDETSTEYMEKFFPTAIDLPKPSRDLLRPMLLTQLTHNIEQSGWLVDATVRDHLVQRFDKLWEAGLDRLCSNIRKVGLLANDVHAAASLVIDEVDAIDLCAIEALRRFYPRAYEVVWSNSFFFSSGAQSWKSGKYVSPGESEIHRRRIKQALESITADGNEKETIYLLLKFMFPVRMHELGEDQPSRSEPDPDGSERRKGISHFDYFPIYFHRTVPELVFSSREMNRVVGELRRVEIEAERHNVMTRVFGSLGRNTVREYDFLHKLLSQVEKDDLEIDVARSVAVAVANHAERLSDEMFISEVNKGLSIVFTVAQRLADSEAINPLLEECIRVASTDHFAARLYSYTTDRRSSNNVLARFDNVQTARLRSAFASRMETRHGAMADVSDYKPERIDIFAFSLWADMGERERDSQVLFWKRFIGDSRRQLAVAFGLIAPSQHFWTDESPAFIDRMLPIEYFRTMYDTLPQNETLDDEDQRALGRLKTFLDNGGPDEPA